MFYILCAVIFAAAVFGLGLILGERLRAAQQPPAIEAKPDPEAEKEAFAILMGYNADVAYGLKSMKE